MPRVSSGAPPGAGQPDAVAGGAPVPVSADVGAVRSVRWSCLLLRLAASRTA